MKIFDYGEVRKEKVCHDRGHDFKPRDYVVKHDADHWRCKCGAEAHIDYSTGVLKITRKIRSRNA